ncbi:hypothetical protein [Fischerella sp.]|nr:hypothetical protein [Fischerella sp.]
MAEGQQTAVEILFKAIAFYSQKPNSDRTPNNANQYRRSLI